MQACVVRLWLLTIKETNLAQKKYRLINDMEAAGSWRPFRCPPIYSQKSGLLKQF